MGFRPREKHTSSRLMAVGFLMLCAVNFISASSSEEELIEDQVEFSAAQQTCGVGGDSYPGCQDPLKLGLKSEGERPAGFGMQVELIHIDHHKESPLHKAESSFGERIKIAIERSNARSKAIAHTLKMHKEHQKKKSLDPEANTEFTYTSKDTSYVTPLASSPGSYVMKIALGSPPQSKTAIADTGSDLIWLQCLPCSKCYSQADPIYDPTKSSTYRQLACKSPYCNDLPYKTCSTAGKCKYGYAYGDQSTTLGDLATETITLTTTTGSTQTMENLAFGCGHTNKGTFSGTDGLVGLGQGPLSFTTQLGSTFDNIFSYCLVSIYSSDVQTSPLVFGDAAVPENVNIRYTPLVRNNQNPTFYYVLLTGISVGGQALNLPSGVFDIKNDGSGGVILDSGTTLTYLIQAAYKPFLEALKALINYPSVDSSQIGLDLCYNLLDVQDPSFPSVTFQFSNVDVDLPADNMFLVVDDKGTTCLAFAGADDFTIYGNIQQQDFYIVTDRKNQQVGFAPAKCGSPHSSAHDSH